MYSTNIIRESKHVERGANVRAVSYFINPSRVKTSSENTLAINVVQ